MLSFILAGWPRPDVALLNELRTPEYAGLGAVVERALSNDPALRYQHVTELIQDVRRLSGVEYDFGAILQRVSPARFQQMFQIGNELGSGQSGKVYRAQDLRTPQAAEVAIKEIVSAQVRGSLERRAEQFYRVRDLSHPNLVALRVFFLVDTKLYVVMELVQGGSLSALMERYNTEHRRFAPADVLRLVSDVARGLAYIHQHGIVHGCVLPTNILIEDGSGRARLSDFAASVLFEGDQWHQSALVRQYAYYLAPEIARGEKATPASDVYSLGCLLSALATGQRGQLGANELFAALEETGQWREDQLERVVDLITGCMSLDASRRTCADGAEFVKAIEGLNQVV